jgi:hypothetical protein
MFSALQEKKRLEYVDIARKIYCHVYECLSTGFWIIGFLDHLLIVTTSNYNSLTELNTPNITVTTAQSSQHSLVVSW